MKKKLKVFYAGDSEAGGAANYLLGILQDAAKVVCHVPPSQPIQAGRLKTRYDVLILSDYPKSGLKKDAEKSMVKQVEDGSGLMMVGGWGSFSGPFGNWRGSEIEKLLPVNCLRNDDRINFSSGAYPVVNRKHPALNGLSFKNPPALCGLNDIHPKQNSEVILSARKIVSVGNHLTLDPVEHPLLVAGPAGGLRTLAYASDFAPHWCGGLVDWGSKRLTLPVSKQIRIEVGDQYKTFVQSLIAWLAGRG